MWSAWCMFAILWVGFAWALLVETDEDDGRHVKFVPPLLKRACTGETVECVDDCSFLCVEKEMMCAGGVCRKKIDDKVSCDESRGGVWMNTGLEWKCLCTDATHWSGEACNELNPDVCEHGMFVYSGQDHNFCVCPYPYVKVWHGGTDHCLPRKFSGFFQEKGLMASMGPAPGP